MKWIKYRRKVGETNIGTGDNPIIEPILQDMGVEYSPANEATIKQIAHNGEYKIVDDGQPEPPAAETGSETEYATYDELARFYREGVNSIDE